MWIALITIVCAILYRLGGIGKPFRSWMRDWLIPLPICLYAFFALGVTNFWLLLLAYGLMGAALTTYWDSLLGYDNFYLHGFMIGLACLPFLTIIPWWIILLRSLALGGAMGLWCKIFGNDWVEELGRGGFIGLTLLIFLI